jgi:phospholipase C
MSENLQQTKSIVVLMLENRSFDNLLGFLYTDDGNKSPNGDHYDGLTGAESNPMPLTAGAPAQPVQVVREKTVSNLPDPNAGEEYAHVNMQLFGSDAPPPGAKATNQGFIWDYDQVAKEESKTADIRGIMHCYDPSMVPCMSEIARRYAVCDRWFSSVPSETWPNRAFAHSASSNSHVNNSPGNPLFWHIPTIFNRIASRPDLSWRLYYDDYFASLTRSVMSQLWAPVHTKNFQPVKQFLDDAKSGNLPSYSFIEPTFMPNPFTGDAPNDFHPVHDVTIGDAFIGKIFNAVVTSPQWQANEVLFMITFDEHGGLYDHVAPPTNAVPPDSRPGAYGFDFRRYGVRVPAILVSPFVPKGSVFRAGGDIAFDHTSILATVERRFGIDPLSQRDAAAADLGPVLSLKTPRNDASPLDIKIPPNATFDAAVRGDLANLPLNKLQQSMVKAMHVAALATPHGLLEAIESLIPKIEAAAEPQARTVGEAFDFIRDVRRKIEL